MAWIEQILPEASEGPLKDLYAEILEKRGAVANVYTIHSLNPASLKNHLDLYLTLMFASSPLSRVERETLAVAVSSANECTYCITHHSEPLVRLTKDATLPAKVMEVPESLSERERALVAFAQKLTRRPGRMAEDDVEALREAGLSDREVLDAALITAYFNFVNRVVSGLGVELEG